MCCFERKLSPSIYRRASTGCRTREVGCQKLVSGFRGTSQNIGRIRSWATTHPQMGERVYTHKEAHPVPISPRDIGNKARSPLRMGDRVSPFRRYQCSAGLPRVLRTRSYYPLQRVGEDRPGSSRDKSLPVTWVVWLGWSATTMKSYTRAPLAQCRQKHGGFLERRTRE